MRVMTKQQVPGEKVRTWRHWLAEQLFILAFWVLQANNPTVRINGTRYFGPDSKLSDALSSTPGCEHEWYGRLFYIGMFVIGVIIGWGLPR